MKTQSRICSLLLILSILMGMTAISAGAADFADVAESDYFYPAVEWGTEAGITEGVDPEHFDPKGAVTRAQAVTFLWRMQGSPEPAAAETFSDVEAGSWYETAVRWAVQNGITVGTGEHLFSPDAVCDRAMCITFLYRMMGCPFDGIDFTAEIELDENSTLEDYGFAMIGEMVKAIRESDLFPDVPQDAYFELPTFWGVLSGIATEENSGITEESPLFRPNDPCIREEMISFLYQTKLVIDLQNAPGELYFGDYSLPVPMEYMDLLSIGYYGEVNEETGEELLLTVSEKASIEAAEAMEEENTDGIGELFRIIRVSESRLHELLCNDMSGLQAFAKDEEGRYYLFCTPTDVRYFREDNEAMEADAWQWTMLNEWARGELIDAILNQNSTLTPVRYTNTGLDICLARIAYDKYTDYTVSTTKYGPLKPKKVDGAPYAEQLLLGTFEEAEGVEAPDGEYVVLDFPEYDMRFDFFMTDKTLVREVHGDFETVYRFGSEGEKTSTDVLEEWYSELAKSAGKR